MPIRAGSPRDEYAAVENHESPRLSRTGKVCLGGKIRAGVTLPNRCLCAGDGDDNLRDRSAYSQRRARRPIAPKKSQPSLKGRHQRRAKRRVRMRGMLSIESSGMNPSSAACGKMLKRILRSGNSRSKTLRLVSEKPHRARADDLI